MVTVSVLHWEHGGSLSAEEGDMETVSEKWGRWGQSMR